MSEKEKKPLEYPKTNYVNCLHAKTLMNMIIAMRSNIRPNCSLSYNG